MREPHPVYQYFHNSANGDQKLCNFCSAKSAGTNRKRLLEHLAFRCHLVSLSIKTVMDDMYRSQYQSQSSQSQSSQMSSSSDANFSQSSSIQSYADVVSKHDKENFDCSLASCFYTLGMPFKLVDHSAFRSFLKDLRPAYKPPHRKELAGALLQAAYNKEHAKMIKALEREQRLTLVTDGWSNIKHQSIINYMLVTGTGTAFFYRADTSASNKHDQFYLSEEMLKVIEEVGASKFVGICTDTAANMKAAVALVQTKYPHIHGVGCASHQLNLVIGDILKLEMLSEPLEQAVEVAKWFRRHHIPNNELEENQKRLYGKTIALALPVSTRWQSVNNCVKALLGSQHALAQTANDPQVEEIMNRDDAGKVIRYTVLNNNFWLGIKKVQRFVEPFLQVIISLESKVPKLSSIYNAYNWISSQILDQRTWPKDDHELITLVESVMMGEDLQ